MFNAARQQNPPGVKGLYILAFTSVAYQPTVDKNFFLHGMKDPQGKENFILFYFDLA